MAATGWRACLPMNTAEAKPSFCRSCSKARPSRLRCWNRNVASPAPAPTKSSKLLPCASRPKCPYFGECGGCHYQHTSYAHQLEIKAAILKENLRRIAKLELDTDLILHPSPEWNYRNRTRLQVRDEPEFALGYYKFNSHQMSAG